MRVSCSYDTFLLWNLKWSTKRIHTIWAYLCLRPPIVQTLNFAQPATKWTNMKICSSSRNVKTRAAQLVFAARRKDVSLGDARLLPTFCISMCVLCFPRLLRCSHLRRFRPVFRLLCFLRFCVYPGSHPCPDKLDNCGGAPMIFDLKFSERRAAGDLATWQNVAMRVRNFSIPNCTNLRSHCKCCRRGSNSRP